jgi:hypothetical protein
MYRLRPKISLGAKLPALKTYISSEPEVRNVSSVSAAAGVRISVFGA